MIQGKGRIGTDIFGLGQAWLKLVTEVMHKYDDCAGNLQALKTYLLQYLQPTNSYVWSQNNKKFLPSIIFILPLGTLQNLQTDTRKRIILNLHFYTLTDITVFITFRPYQELHCITAQF